MGAIAQRRRGVAPGAGAIGGDAVEQRGAVVDLDDAVGFRRAGQGQRVVVGDVVADHTAVGGECGNASGATGAVVSMVTASALEATPVLPAASVAVAVRLWAPLLSAVVV